MPGSCRIHDQLKRLSPTQPIDLTRDVTSSWTEIIRRKATTRTRPRAVSPDDYRRLAEDSVRRCLALPANHKRSRAVALIMAKAWAKLADQTEEWRKDHHRAAA